MKRLIYFSFVLLQLISGKTVKASDTSYILLRVRGTEIIPQSLDKSHYLQQQLLITFQNEWKRKEVIVILSDDSLRVASTHFNFAIDINVVEVHVNPSIINQQTRTVSRDVTTNTYKDESEDIRKEHATLYADLTVTEKTMTALLRLSVSTIKLPETIPIWNELIAESFNWENKSATYTGNFQALGSKEIVLTRAKPRPAPAETDVYREMVRQCIDKSSRKIANSINLKLAG